ncbi:hypothetical protein [Costertonia aggregata]|uniref:Uncharacterized protein n=1 Tax=Costertonia aggregata TaxID=343403 RepID=A0A7H9ANB9_9FLAO|nr:hypothetical protein [Costertonia aggregata]QLG44942.1 hypothetical protein HYG79_06105 [Costertonia aggregata]
MESLCGDIMIGVLLGFGIASFLVSIYFLVPVISGKRKNENGGIKNDQKLKSTE